MQNKKHSMGGMDIFWNYTLCIACSDTFRRLKTLTTQEKKDVPLSSYRPLSRSRLFSLLHSSQGKETISGEKKTGINLMYIFSGSM